MYDHRNFIQAQMEQQQREERLRDTTHDTLRTAKHEALELFRTRRQRKTNK